jgi:pimeloyl-ACP methyl ester carboxylesterase
MITEHRFWTGEGYLNFATGTVTGKPIVFFHGVTRRWQDFLTLMPSVSLRWHIHALDFRGHGLSSRAKTYFVVDHLRDAAAFVQGYFHQPVVLYGHSLGALVAAGVASAIPEMVSGIVLEDPPATLLMKHLRETPFHAMFTGMKSLAHQQHPLAQLSRELADLEIPIPGGKKIRLGQLRDSVAIRFLARSLQLLDPEVLTPVVEERWLEGYDVESTYRGIQCPTLLLRADETVGGMLDRPEAIQLVRWIPDCTLIEMSDVGHLIHWIQPETTAKYLAAFLESL